MIQILSSLFTSVQDTGRHGWAHAGVPVSGAFDAISYTACLDLLDEQPGVPAFEVLAGAFSFTASVTVTAAVVGAAQVHIDGHSVGAHHTLTCPADSIVTITPTRAQPVYVAIAGMRAPRVLGSASMDSLSGLGGTTITAGMTFPVSSPERDLTGRFLTSPVASSASVVRVTRGPHGHLPAVDTRTVVGTVSRSGIRLSAHTPIPAGSAQLASIPVFPGAIQLPPDGQPIILGPDSGVTGGYPVVAVVIPADLPLLARLQPGADLILRTVTMDEAQAAQMARSHVHSVHALA